MSELKPCPFCGGEAETWDGTGVWHVFCTNKDCAAMGSPCLTEAEAIAAWNTRAERETINKTGEFVTHDSRATGGTLTAEQVREAIFDCSAYASYDGAKYYADGINMQAIADELNTSAERTCKVEGDYWHDHGGDGSDTYEYVLSCGHRVEWLDDDEKPRYCPRCGARIEVDE